MSTDPLAVEEHRGHHAERCDGHEHDVEHTPRSEVPPPQLTVITPSATEMAATRKDGSHDGDYFTLANAATPVPSAATASPSTLHTGHERRSPSPRAPAPRNLYPAPDSSAAVVGDATATGSEYIQSPDELRARPTPQQTISSLSIESVGSAATVKTVRPPARTGITFPNQSFSALHNQQYPPYYIAPVNRRPVPHGASINTFTSAIGSQRFHKAHTSHNSPAVTPSHGLFSPIAPPTAPAVESEASSGTYSSPFLHPAHRQKARDTHVAEVELDPISGRKLINQYEIVDELGRGTHGKVKLGRDLNEGGYVAIKIVERFSKRRKLGRLGTTEDKVKKEVAILKKARHPNVVGLLEVIDDPSRKKVYIVLEWLERGEINWRVQGPREIAMVEARRYQREKNEARTGCRNERLAAEDKAVLDEAKSRLEKQKRLRLRKLRMAKRGIHEAPEAWSHEMAGDDMSEESEEDRLSRISSITGDMTIHPTTQHATPTQLLEVGLGRRPSRAPSPLQPALDTTLARPSTFLMLTAEPETMSPITNTASDPLPIRSTGLPTHDLSDLEGTMYGAYDHLSDPSSRIASLPSSLRGSQYGSSHDLANLAQDLLDTHLDAELMYVPVMTMDQIRIAFRDTLLGLQYLHRQGIIHRDIKPPNLLSTIDNRVKISDFGVSYLGRPVDRDADNEDVSETDAQDQDEAKELAKTVGTPAFYAPELCNTDPLDEPLPVTKAIDVWALGITLFCMLFARTPFVDNEFVVMRHISDEEVFIPQQRLQPVDTKSASLSRPSSHSRFAPTRRNDLDFVYESLGDDLMDLLKRLLIKDPRKRISLEDVRHHPWVLADLANKTKWLEETDPHNHTEGQKIEISNEELDTAVVPLNMAERLKSIVKKSADAVGRVITGRTRGQSSAGHGKEGSPGPSTQSSSSSLSQDGRRHSIRDVDFFKALKASRESEHPLSNSVAASPELEKGEQIIPRLNGTSDSSNRLARTASRPSPPHRAMTIASAAGSMRTVTQSDYAHIRNSPPPSPGLPGNPHQLAASPAANHLGGLVTGTARNIMKSIRASSRQRSRNGRGISSERGSDKGSAHSYDPHGEASLAVSQATAAGHMQQPEALRGEVSPQRSTHNSPSSSRQHSVTSESHLHPETGILSRLSSSSSLASINRYELFRNAGRTFSRTRKPNESSAEDWRRADEERIRKLVREHRDEAEKSASSSPVAFASPETFVGATCPSSPDDHERDSSQKREDSTAMSLTTDMSTPVTPDEAISPTNPGHLPHALVSSSSDLGSAVSMSISNPSIPSAISEASSVDVEEHRHGKAQPASDDTINPAQRSNSHEFYDEGYTPDEEAVNYSDEAEEEYESDSDSDGGLVMGPRRKSATKMPPSERRGTGLSTRSKKSSRSGSNNTMKKVRTRESSDEQSRRSLDISEE